MAVADVFIACNAIKNIAIKNITMINQASL